MQVSQQLNPTGSCHCQVNAGSPAVVLLCGQKLKDQILTMRNGVGKLTLLRLGLKQARRIIAINHNPILKNILVAAFFSLSAWAQSSPPAGALIVRQTNSGTSGAEFTTISSAVAALSRLTGPQTIFIYPGTYTEQVKISYPYSLSLQGYSSNPTSSASNQVTVRAAVSAAQAGSNSKSATIWAYSPGLGCLIESFADNFTNCCSLLVRIRNVINSFGTGTDTQALALAATGRRQVFKHCVFSSFQDTVSIEGTSYFFESRIEGAVDFVFGSGSAWFEAVILAIKPASSPVITAQRNSPGGITAFVFNRAQVISAGASAGSAYLGRPWSEDATVIFQFCSLSDVINPAGWRIWAPSQPNTARAKFQEYRNSGPGASTRARQLGTQMSSQVEISSILGSDYSTWAQ
ncbi:hypothetical protein PtA15_3A722 [Puccinia triticina]|uniref:Pectinesterase n=1 Tax=Puccinia triticina TaxID=208348 RepID=A0ABY7CKL2_9BASI|nr:uncharacterized protein PtA15_3A722 [Puccinia triticina]WAQ83352.1 hypothetical protein PtA15_3A722 [Puccinia triticina]WAR54199.1 hypothetical protein PtB15_3B712 [Puccinia triticina]